MSDPTPTHGRLDPDRPIRRVAFLFALTEEGLGLAERLGLEDRGRLDPALPAHWWCGEIPSGDAGAEVGACALEVAAGFAGVDPELGVDRIGTVAASMAGYKLCQAFKPDLLVNAGTCGGFRGRGGDVGRVYVADRGVLFHDRRIPIPGWHEFGVGRIPAAVTDATLEVLEASRGIVSTGDSFTPSADELAFFDREEVAAKEMEAAAVARLARDLGIAFLAVKAVTDLVDAPEPEQDAFARNLAMVSRSLQDRLANLIGWLRSGRRVGEVIDVEPLARAVGPIDRPADT